MTEKEGDSEVLRDEGEGSGTRLLSQPTCISGKMRPYQLEGLNWLIRNHENGINGILADEMGESRGTAAAAAGPLWLLLPARALLHGP